MLQEEGLVEIEPNQRTGVAGLDPQELDDVYAGRILLETLALSMTMGGFGRPTSPLAVARLEGHESSATRPSTSNDPHAETSGPGNNPTGRRHLVSRVVSRAATCRSEIGSGFDGSSSAATSDRS
jgi:hypothetical protein